MWKASCGRLWVAWIGCKVCAIFVPEDHSGNLMGTS